MKITKYMTLACVALPASAVAQGAGIMPGEWDIAVTMNSVEMPGQPRAVTQMMVGKTNHVRHCITAADAARGPQDLMKAAKGCTFTRYTMIGGKLSSEMSCSQPGGGTMTAVSSGSFTPTGFTTTGRSMMTGNGMAMKMTSTTVGKRLGPCKK